MDNIFPKGDHLPEQFAKYFTGTATLKMLTTEGVPIGNVTFDPGCRNNWHIHHKGGQILLVTGGRGWFSHLAVEVPTIVGSYEWLEPVTDEEYNKLI